MLGHAGLYLETTAGSILCDPWTSPAYFASWFPFPDNSALPWDRYAHPDYLYVSHLHQDHFDPAHLRERVGHDTTVLLPDYPLDDLRDALAALGFTRFRHLPNGEPVDLGSGLRVAITAVSAPVDGPIGDSALAVADGTACILDQNDARPLQAEQIAAFGPYDAHFLQFSGASWWPLAYDLPARAKAVYGRAARRNGLARAQRFVEQVGARHVVPNAGPACFLDDDLFDFNDLHGEDHNPFPDQSVFVDHLHRSGHPEAVLTVPGTVLEFTRGRCEVRHPAPDAFTPFRDKEAYLRSYAARARPRIEQERRTWRPAGSRIDVLSALRDWFEPLLRIADRICAGVGGPVLLDIGDLPLVIDFPAREVRRWDGEPCRYRFRFERDLVERLIADRQVDWVNSLLLGMRFTTSRVGPYNEHVYTFFKCLSPERISYADAWYAEPEVPSEFIRLADWEIQRRCPHLRADLARFGEIQDGVLRCRMHNWRFDLETGRCLNAYGHRLTARPAGDE
ncbi:Rieske 2Fe-2S domain-containing protein [Streptomyces diastatochromogenes]|uniref:Rieske 2Fe-2S domain-containing protein n=1 Tax=Streptomyces diastatochromogenes TaxID=42236 RepID=UPI0036CECFFB